MRPEGPRPLTTGDEMVRRYYGTKMLRKSSPTSMVLYLDKTWGFQYKDKVRIRARSIDESDSSLLCTIKNVSKVGNSLCVYIPAEWGFTYGDMLVYTVEAAEPEQEEASEPVEKPAFDEAIIDDLSSDEEEPVADDDA